MMNIGAGDIIVLSTLAFKCYKLCKESSEQFKWVAAEVRNLRCALDEVRESIEEYQPLSPTRQERVNTGVRECEGSLRELEAELDRYQSLYTQDQRLHEKVKFAAKNVANLRDRIKAQTTNLEMLSFAIQSESQKRIIQLLTKFCAEHRAGRRQESVLSSRSSASTSIYDTDWEQLRREVADVGTPRSVIDANGPMIRKWLQDAWDAGALQEDPSLVHRYREDETLISSAPAGPEGKLRAQARSEHPAPSSIGFRSSEPTIFGDMNSSGRPPEDHETIDPLTRPAMEDEPPVRVSMEPGPSTSRKGTDLFHTKYQGISDVSDHFADTTISLEPTTTRRKSSGLASLLFKLTSSSQKIIQAASNNEPEEISRLLGLGVDVNTKDKWGWTAMSMAAYGGYEEVARILMSHGATLDHEDVDGDSPFTLARNKGHPVLLRMIEEETTRRATDDEERPQMQERKSSLAALKKWRTR